MCPAQLARSHLKPTHKGNGEVNNHTVRSVVRRLVALNALVKTARAEQHCLDVGEGELGWDEGVQGHAGQDSQGSHVGLGQGRD